MIILPNQQSKQLSKSEITRRALDHVELNAGAGVPEDDEAVAAGAEQQRGVRREAQREDESDVAFGYEYRYACIRVYT